MQEALIIDRVTRMPNVVVATGGGCVENCGTREILRQRGIVFYLSVSLQQQQNRLRYAKDRPLLDIAAGLKFRDQLYLDIADFKIKTDNKSVAEVVTDVHNICRGKT